MYRWIFKRDSLKIRLYPIQVSDGIAIQQHIIIDDGLEVLY